MKCCNTIVLRGTTANPKSILADFYVAMLPAQSSITIPIKDTIPELPFTVQQEERKLENIYSVNLPTRYRLKDKERAGWINIINGFRGGVLLMGLPGSGKTLIAKEIIKQQISKGYAMFIHDFKYPDLTRVAYSHYLRHKHRYKVEPEFHILHF